MVLKAGWQLTVNGSFVTCYANLTQTLGSKPLARISVKQCIYDCGLMVIGHLWSSNQRKSVSVKCVSFWNTSGQRKETYRAIRAMITAIQKPYPRKILKTEIKRQMSIIFCLERSFLWIGSWQNSCPARTLPLSKEGESFWFKNENSYIKCGQMNLSQLMIEGSKDNFRSN